MNEIPYEEAAAILGKRPRSPIAPRTPPPMPIPNLRLGPKVNELLQNLPPVPQVSPPIQLGHFFLIHNTMAKAQFKRDVSMQQKEYQDLYAVLSIHRNALDERIQLIFRTVQQMRSQGIPLSKQELQRAEQRIGQFEEAKRGLLQQLVVVDAHLQQMELFLQKVGKIRIRRRQ